jgi:hypothetical protein
MYDELSNVKTDILDGYQGQYKTVIICHSAAEVDELVPFLESQCFQVLAAHEDMTSYHNVGKYTFFFIVGILCSMQCSLLGYYFVSTMIGPIQTMFSRYWRQTIHVKPLIAQCTYYL